MKRIISLLLALVLVCGLVPAAHAAGGAVSSNLDGHWYVNAQRWATPVYSHLAYENGEYVRVECLGDELVVEYYTQDFKFRSGKTIELELPLYGGVYMSTDYNFLVVGQTNFEEDDGKEVFRIIRYTKDWKRVDHASIYGANTTVPFDAGSCRFDRSGNVLYIRTAHEMYTSDDGLNHQSNVMIALRISDMTVTDQLTKAWNSSYGYVSHSFNQFVRVDGDTLLAVDHGDYYPRSVALFKYGKKAGSETFYSKTTMVNALPIVSSTYHYNDTGVSLGGFEFSSTDYLIAGSSYDQKVSADLMEVHRNIFVTATPKNAFTDEDTRLHWLTSYKESDNVSVSPPHLLKLSADRFFLTWTENDVQKYCFLNGKGQPEGGIRTFDGQLSDCVPILANGKIVWYVTDWSEPVFYQIDICAHSYTASVTKPTCTAGGYTTYTCKNCGHCYVADQTAALGHGWSAWETLQAPTCTAEGMEQRSCSRCGKTESRTLAALGHDFEDLVTAPTCTEQGYTTHVCTRCGHRTVDSYTNPTGHREVPLRGREATCTEPGLSEGLICEHCGLVIQAQSEIPALGHDIKDLVTAPTCTERGYTTHACTRCDYRTVDSYTNPTGHREVPLRGREATCTEPGLSEGLICEHCGVVILAQSETPALGHDFEDLVTAPTCTEQGYTTHVCTRCDHRTVDSYTNPTGHREVPLRGREATCTESGLSEGLICEHCGLVIQAQSEIPALGHDWQGTECGRCGVTRLTPFDDVVPGSFYELPVAWAVDNGVTSGISATEFGPNVSCNRAQVVTFLWRAADCPEPAAMEHPFVDVQSGSFYEKAVIWAVENGITAGLDATHFGPNTVCNRAQVVTFLWRAQGKPHSDASTPFTDVKAGDFYEMPVRWAVENGITSGISATEFGALTPCNRAQVVTFLYRTLS